MNAKNITCTKCHGDKLQGGKIAPSCESCHKYYPHANFLNMPNSSSTNWAMIHFQSSPFTYILKTSCDACHNGNMKEWVRPAGCFSTCHAFNPYIKDGKKP